jgi:hypothetical protein
MSTGPFTRVNGELIKSFRGQSVSLLGKLKKVSVIIEIIFRLASWLAHLESFCAFIAVVGPVHNRTRHIRWENSHGQAQDADTRHAIRLY